MPVLNSKPTRSRAAALVAGTCAAGLLAVALVQPVQAAPMAAVHGAEPHRAGPDPALHAVRVIRRTTTSTSGKKVVRAGRNYDKVTGREVVVVNGRRVVRKTR
jgi:hypothetical protein